MYIGGETVCLTIAPSQTSEEKVPKKRRQSMMRERKRAQLQLPNTSRATVYKGNDDDEE